MQLMNVGYGNMVASNRIVAIVSPESAPIRRIVTEAREANYLIDATHSRKTRAVIITDTKQVILVALQPETIALRFVKGLD